MGSLQVEELVHTSWSRFWTINHRASTSNHQLSNMKRPGRDLNRRPQRLKASTLTSTYITEPGEPLPCILSIKQHHILSELQNTFHFTNLNKTIFQYKNFLFENLNLNVIPWVPWDRRWSLHLFPLGSFQTHQDPDSFQCELPSVDLQSITINTLKWLNAQCM